MGTNLPSMPHIRMTVEMLRAAGAQVDTPESGGEPNVAGRAQRAARP